jgi:hypothetical protein
LPLPAKLEKPVPQVLKFRWQRRRRPGVIRLVERMALGRVDVIANSVAVGGLA